MSEKTLRICHLYPDLLNLYGDRGNILCMRRRLEWRGIDAEVTEVTVGEQADFTQFDLFFIGGGQDFERLAAMGEHLRHVFVSGTRADELRLRLKYAGVDETKIQVYYDYDPLIDAMCASEYPVFIMPTYTSMLDLRGRLQKRLGGKEFWE